MKNPFASINKEDLEMITCPKCQNNIFAQYFQILRVSALKSMTGKEQYLNTPVFICANCGEILDVTEEKSSKPEEKPSLIVT
jgi:hypothetical protein